MEDLKTKLERLRSEAVDCEMIGNLATDKEKRDLFRKLARDLHNMAQDIESLIAMRAGAGDRTA